MLITLAKFVLHSSHCFQQVQLLKLYRLIATYSLLVSKLILHSRKLNRNRTFWSIDLPQLNTITSNETRLSITMTQK